MGVSIGGVPCSYGPGLNGNDPLLSLRLHSFNFLYGFGVALGDERSHMGGVLICSPLYVLVAYVWDIVGHILFSGVYIKLYIGDCLFVVL